MELTKSKLHTFISGLAVGIAGLAVILLVMFLRGDLQALLAQSNQSGAPDVNAQYWNGKDLTDDISPGGAWDFSNATLTVATPTTASEVSHKNYVDTNVEPNTDASTECSGTSTYLSGQGTCENQYSGGLPSDIATTTATHDGNFGGYDGMQTWIENNGCSGYHVCTNSELVRYLGEFGVSGMPEVSAWYNTGAANPEGNETVDCGGWTISSGSYGGHVWDNGFGYLYIDTCDMNRYVLCCKY